MKKKAISLLLVAAMTATMTAGCGDKQEAKRQHNCRKRCGTFTEAAASDDARTEEEEEAWSGTLTVWSPQEDQDTGWLQKECDAFNAAHQTGMSHLSMVYVQRVMQKLLSQQTLRDLQMSICWQTITSLI